MKKLASIFLIAGCLSILMGLGIGLTTGINNNKQEYYSYKNSAGIMTTVKLEAEGKYDTRISSISTTYTKDIDFFILLIDFFSGVVISIPMFYIGNKYAKKE